MDIITAVAEKLMNTPPSHSRRPSMSYALPPLPTFESTWDFSQFRSQSPSSPQPPSTPSRTRITSPLASVSTSPTKNSIGQASPSWTTSSKKPKMSCLKAPPPSPLLRPVQSMNDQAMRDVRALASLSLSIAKSSTDLSAVPGMTDSFTSSSYSSDEHHSDTDVDDDPYRTSSEKAWNLYYAPQKQEICEQSYILPSAESCYALGFGKLGCLETPSPVKNTSPIRRQMRSSPTRTRTAPAPASSQVRPSMSIRRQPSGKSTKSSRTITQQRFDRNPSPTTVTRTNTSTTTRPSRPLNPPRIPSPAISLATALSTIPPPPPPQTFLPALPLPPPTRRSFARERHMHKASQTHLQPQSPPADYRPPYLSLFPMSARHSTPNTETPPWPVPTRRAPRPVTAPATQSSIAVGVHASTTVLGSAGGAFIAQPQIEKSVWEDDSSDEEEQTQKGKWHLRTGSSSSRGSGKGSVQHKDGKEGFKEKEKWGKRSASDVVRSLFMKHGGN